MRIEECNLCNWYVDSLLYTVYWILYTCILSKQDISSVTLRLLALWYLFTVPLTGAMGHVLHSHIILEMVSLRCSVMSRTPGFVFGTLGGRSGTDKRLH